MRCRSFHQLQITQRGKFNNQVLQCLSSLIDDKNVCKQSATELYIW
jgi:hypothetical protein